MNLANKGETEGSLQRPGQRRKHKLDLQFTDVFSPIDGRVSRGLVNAGNLVVKDQTLLTTVVSEDPIYAYFDVDKHTLLNVQRLGGRQRHRHRRHPGALLAKLQSEFGGGTGFWGYNVYRENPGSTTYGLVGQVAENPSATSSTTYSFTDTGSKTPGEAPGSGSGFPSATNPGIDCSSAAGSGIRPPARRLTPRSSRRSAWTRRSPRQRPDQLRPGRGRDR